MSSSSRFSKHKRRWMVSRHRWFIKKKTKKTFRKGHYCPLVFGGRKGKIQEAQKKRLISSFLWREKQRALLNYQRERELNKRADQRLISFLKLALFVL